MYFATDVCNLANDIMKNSNNYSIGMLVININYNALRAA